MGGDPRGAPRERRPRVRSGRSRARPGPRLPRMLRWGVAVMLLLAGLSVAAMTALHYSGRTPSEVINYALRRLQGHPTLEAMARPVLQLVRSAFDEPDEADLEQPFDVPRLPPNPMRPPAPGEASEGPDVLRVGPGRALTSIAAAASLAVDGSVIEIDPGDYVNDVAVWDRARLTIRGLGDRVRLIARGASAEGKATWVVRRGEVVVENIEFVGARAADLNGAGIRMEGGHLTVRRCRFHDNENGILTGPAADAELDVEASEFGYSGNGTGLAHGIYVGPIARFRLVGSYVHHGNVGHLVKSRARQSRIEYNRLADGVGGRASYELEFPNGGLADVVGNVVQQGETTSNSVMLSYGAEGYRWPQNELRVVHNTLVNDRRNGGRFVSAARGAGRVQLRNNLLVGPGLVDVPSPRDEAGDEHTDWSELVRPSREDYRIREQAAPALGEHLAPVEPALAPKAEYRHPAGTAVLGRPPRWPGALQETGP